MQVQWRRMQCPVRQHGVLSSSRMPTPLWRRSNSARATRLRLHMLLLLLSIASACSQTPTSGPASALTDAEDESTMPAEALIEQALGIPMPEIRRRVEIARIDAAIECVEADGFELSPSQVASLEDIPPPPPDFGGNVEAVVASRLGQEDQANPQISPGLNAAVGRCLERTNRTFVDPFGAYDDWLENLYVDLNTRVSADPRFVQAVRDERRCIQGLGYASGDVAEVSNALTSMANEIIDRYDAGRISREVMEGELRNAEATERTLSPEVTACVQIRLKVERAIASEVQRDAIAQQGETIREVVRTVQRQVRRLDVDGTVASN